MFLSILNSLTLNAGRGGGRLIRMVLRMFRNDQGQYNPWAIGAVVVVVVVVGVLKLAGGEQE